MGRFGSDPHTFFDNVYKQAAPWDIGGPQPALTALFDKFPPQDAILDVGCGSGDLSIFLAKRGHQALGIDFVEAAIAQAREKAAGLPHETARLLDFQVADALRPSLLQRQFGSVVDSGFLHLFDLDQSEHFTGELAMALRPGGRYYLLAFAVEFPIPNSPRAVSIDELQRRFAPEKGWHILDIGPANFQNRVAMTPATRACIERLPATSSK